MTGRADARARKADKVAATGDGLNRRPFGQPRRMFAATELISADQVEQLHVAAMHILEETGLEVRHAGARDLFAKAGAVVQDQRVRIGRDVIAAAISWAPQAFTLHARNPEHDLRIGDDYLTFCHVSGPPNASDLAGDDLERLRIARTSSV